MKKVSQLLILLCVSFLANAADLTTHTSHLFILSGQSNMARFNPDISFTPALKKAFPNDGITVVKDAQGGQLIERWYQQPGMESMASKPGVTNDLYQRLMGKVKAATSAAAYSTVTFIWMQGESDAAKHYADLYETRLRGLIAQLKQDLGRDDIDVVIGRISDFGVRRKKQSRDWEMIRNAQVQVAEADSSHSIWVDTDDLNGDVDKLHYTDEGYRILGERFALAAIKLINNKTSPLLNK
ncbi:MAG: sialate O-acetylesterase [Methylovulum sp.]|nr:sialate O-acetylesterase [Methylovulum sp.]